MVLLLLLGAGWAGVCVPQRRLGCQGGHVGLVGLPGAGELGSAIDIMALV